MQNTTLENFIGKVSQQWSGLNTATVESVRQLLQELSQHSVDTAWLAQLKQERPAAKELYRDPQHGFILLAHCETQGQYRQPHNHGAGWVFYTVLSGEMAMSTYQQLSGSGGESRLVSRGSDILRAGQCRVFLPGDIHDTRCLSADFVQLRLTSTDFKAEQQAGRMLRFDV